MVEKKSGRGGSKQRIYQQPAGDSETARHQPGGFHIPGGKNSFSCAGTAIKSTPISAISNRPMGIAVKPDRMSIGCLKTLENYQNAPELIERFEKPGNHDACYVPRTSLEDRGHRHSRDGLGPGRKHPVGGQYPFFMPVPFRFRKQFRPPLAARVYLGPGRGRPLSLERPGHGERRPLGS